MKYKTYQDFMYEIKNDEVVIYKYVGNLEEVVTPETIEGKPVRVINASLIGNAGFTKSEKVKKVVVSRGVKTITMMSFIYCPSLEEVVIPASVEELDISAFSGRSSVKAILVDEENPVYASMDGVLFSKDKSKLLCFPHGKSYETGGDIPEGRMRVLSYSVPKGTTEIGDDAFSDSYLIGITIPDSVATISGRAFNDCRFLEEINLPAGLLEIDYDVFQNCSSLEHVEIPCGVTKIDFEAFDGCTALKEMDIPNTVTKIRFAAFRGCSSLTHMVIPDGVCEIENNTFADCSSLISISLPASVTKIDLSAFDGCQGLERIDVDEKNPVYEDRDGVLYKKEGDKPIYTPRALLSKNMDNITSQSQLVGKTDEELLDAIGKELGFDVELKPDEGWECAGSRFEWYERRYRAEDLKIYAFSEGDRITKLTFSGLDIDHLPLAIAGLSALTVLDLSYTKVTELPEWISTFSNLEVLNIYGSTVKELPDFIGNLTNLKELHLGATKLSQLPDSLCQLKRLEVLHLNHTDVAKLPEGIGELTSLLSMNLHGSKIAHLPESIGNCKALEWLLSYYMPLEELPESIGNLSALECLWICQTKVKELPESIVNLTALNDFDYKPGRIKELPEALENILKANKKKLEEEEKEGLESEEDETGVDDCTNADRRKTINISLVIPDTEWEDED